MNTKNISLHFAKMHGLGNDFVVIDAIRTHPNWQTDAHTAAALLDRHFGIGGDQLLVLSPAENGENDARMSIYNADGSQVEMCGNGIRCCALFLAQNGITQRNTLRIETLAGVITPTILDENVKVDMGTPRLNAEDIPVSGITGRILHAPPPPVSDTYELPFMSCVSMGNPHTVFFVDDVGSVPLERIGPQIENHPWFPQRTNVHFAQVIDRTHIRLRVWERGSGITCACGTGACGTVVAAILNELTDTTVIVTLDGGDLTVAWPDSKGVVWMTGPATYVFDGIMNNTTI
jgi:diaminopimelate epimerase